MREEGGGSGRPRPWPAGLEEEQPAAAPVRGMAGRKSAALWATSEGVAGGCTRRLRGESSGRGFVGDFEILKGRLWEKEKDI